MNKIQRFHMEDFMDTGFEMTVEVDRSVMTDEVLHQINNFWGESKHRLAMHDGNVLFVVLELLFQQTLRCVASEGGEISIPGLITEFDHHLEGWPPMDGSFGIKFVEVGMLDLDKTPTIKELSA